MKNLFVLCLLFRRASEWFGGRMENKTCEIPDSFSTRAFYFYSACAS